jgi:iron complex outermembrane receptor protein
VLAIAVARAVPGQTPGEVPSVIVTAEKREAPIQDVPIAISALSADELHEGGIGNAEALAQRLPTLDLERNAGLNTTILRIRRVGNIGNIPTFEPSVGLFVDSAFRSRSFLGASNLLGVDRVEVLRGPQTALYGKNVSSGVVALYTRKPAQELTVFAELSGGRIDSPKGASAHEVKIDVSGPLGAGFGGSLSAQLAEHGHTITNVLAGGPDGDNGRQFTARGQLAWSASDALDLTLLAGYLKQRDDEGESDVFLAPGAASTQVSGLLQQLGLSPGCADNVPRNRKLCSVETNKLELAAKDVTLLMKYRLDNGWTLKSITGWDAYDILRLEGDAIQLFAPMLFYNDAEHGHSEQEELTLESASGGRFAWLVGSFYYRNLFERGDGGREPMFGPNGELAFSDTWPALLGLPLAIPGQLGIHDSQLNTQYISVFAQTQWELTPRWRVTTAVRWQRERKQADIDNSVTEPGLSLISAILAPAVTLAGEPVNGRLRRTSENVPWSVTPQFRFSDDALSYLTVARGSKSGGYNTGFGDSPLTRREFADESVHHYELGAKTSFAKRRVLLDAAAFYTRYDNFQDAAFISAQFSVGNAERVDLKGVELEGSALLNRQLTVDYSVSLADLRYVTHTNGLCHPGRIPDGSTPTSCILSGSHPIQAPKWATHFGLRYEQPRSWGSFFARADWSWTDSYNTSFSADPRLTQAAHSIISARVGLKLGRSTELALWSNNLLNENVSYFDSLLNLFNDESYQSYLAPPRSYGITLRLRL